MTTEKATREAFGEALKQLGKDYPNVVVLDADLSVSTKSEHFAKEYPERFFQMGIAEQNMIGTAAGLSFTGLIPFACSFSAFIATRYETIRVSIGYSKANVKLVGTHAGLGVGEDGYTQMGLEDMGILRTLPGLIILNPSDETTTHAAVRFAVEHVGPVYLRLTRQRLPRLYRTTTIFQMGRAIILKEGKEIALVATGASVNEAMKACEELSSMSPWLLDVHTIKPIDKLLIRSLANQCKYIFTVEDHNTIGGLGSAVAEVLAEYGTACRLIRIGVQDTYGESGSPQELYEKYGLSAKKIVARVWETLKQV